MFSYNQTLSLLAACMLFIRMGVPVQAQDTAPDFIEALVDRTTAYIGEPILYTWRWYVTAGNVDLNKDVPVMPPSFDAFGQETLEISGEVALRDGHPYQIITQQILLYPRREGNITIDPVRVAMPQTISANPLESTPLTLTIKPLPADTPPMFGNAVGQFDLQAAIDRQEAKTGDPVTFTMTITGSGNIPMMIAPSLTLGEEWRIYPAESRARRDNAFLGERVFSWMLIPLQPGMLTIPSQAWSFLNPQTGRYETRDTTPFAVTVTGEAIAESPIVSAVIEPTLYPLYYSAGLPRDNKPSLGVLRSDKSATPYVLSSFPEAGLRHVSARSSGGIDELGLICGVVPPILAFIIWFWSRFRGVNRINAPALSQKRKRSTTYQDRLVALAQKSPQDIPLGVQAILQDYLAQKYGISITSDVVDALSDLPAEIQNGLQTCFDSVDAARYAPFTPQDAKRLLQDAHHLIRTMEAS